jgi:hypothetical protein
MAKWTDSHKDKIIKGASAALDQEIKEHNKHNLDAEIVQHHKEQGK